MIFCANELPKPVDLSTGFFRRWILIDFPYTFYTAEEYDNHIGEKDAKKADNKARELKKQEFLKKELESKPGIEVLFVSSVSAVVGTHTGPGALLVAFHPLE